MERILDKLAFRFLIGQLVPGAGVVLSILLVNSRTGAEPDPITNLGELLDSYALVIGQLTTGASLVTFIVAASAVGLILQGISNLSAANLESFRTVAINDVGEWVKLAPEDVRARSGVRVAVAGLWKNRSAVTIWPVAPLILAFDIISILAAKPSHLYKDVHFVRAKMSDSALLNQALTDIEYMASYFSNVALALSLMLGLIAMAMGSGMLSVAGQITAAGLYLLVGLHYVLARVYRTSLDHALFETFKGDDRGVDREFLKNQP